jgi:hypothetical protein
MDLASGYSDSFNYGNGYTPLANNAINNNNAAYNANQAYASGVGSYNPFTQSGGFGAQTDYYSGLGAAYGRATGGFNGGGGSPYSGGGIGSDAARVPGMDYFYQEMENLGRGGIGSDAGQSPGQYQNPAVDWSRYMTQTVAPQTGGISNQQQNPWGTSAGYDYNEPQTYAPNQSGWGSTPANPSMDKLLGYTPNTPYSGGGIGSDAARAPGMDYFYHEQAQNAQRDQLANAMASFNDRFGNLPGQPYGQGYFDNTFGSVANTGGTSFAPYKGNTSYMPDPMQGQQPVQGGGGFGASGFGLYGGSSYTGQPGYGLGIGQIGPSGSSVYGGDPAWTGDQNTGGTSYGYGGMTGGPARPLEPWLNAS